MKLNTHMIIALVAMLGAAGCQQNQPLSTQPTTNNSQLLDTQPDTGSTNGDSAAGAWGRFNEVLRDGGVYKNSTGKYMKLTFDPLKDNLDAVFADAPKGNVTITNASGDRSNGAFSVESDRTLTISLSGKNKKMVFDLSKDGNTLSSIDGKQKLVLQR
ncbi:MAG: hypothetical protein QM758_14755 [Armatimonas sp.]